MPELPDTKADTDDPLERLYDHTGDEDFVETETVALGETAFRDRLATIADAAGVIDALASDAATLRASGLRESDVRDLIYGRNSQLRKSDIEAVLDALDELHDTSTSRRDDLFVRLLADVSGLGIRDTEEIVAELRALHERYPPGDSA